jgi:hypothetical protein
VRFEPGSALSEIEELCFANCGCRSQSIYIPRSVQVLGKSCLDGAQFQVLAFEFGSEPTRIEDFCFHDGHFQSLTIPPMLISFIHLPS